MTMNKKTIILFCFFVGLLSEVSAQGTTNVNHLNLCLGALYERGFDATLSYEHEVRYHNSWEYFANAYIQYDKDSEAGHITKDSFWKNYFTYNLGIAYKPCVIRGRNHHGNLRVGASGGSDTEKFIGAVHLGYEHTYALRGGWGVFWQVKEDVVFRGNDLFRTGVTVGLKLPL